MADSRSGRPVGIARAHKPDSELSTNPRTIAERKRRARKEGFPKRILDAKRADAQAFQNRKKGIFKSAEWLALGDDKEAQQQFLEVKKEEIKQER
jgi:hypothetical protein